VLRVAARKRVDGTANDLDTREPQRSTGPRGLEFEPGA
jgi:hypothetical protein